MGKQILAAILFTWIFSTFSPLIKSGKEIYHSSNDAKKRLYQWLTVIGFSTIAVICFSKVVPFNMDEFGHYHYIICHHYKMNSLNSFRESCGGYDLNLFNSGLILPLRSYAYTGTFPSVYYYPLFLIWKDPHSARLLGMIFLIMQAFLLGKIFNINFLFFFIGLVLFFPYCFQHMVDTGPIGFQTTSIFLIYFLIDRWLTSNRIIYLLTVSFIIFLGVWTKLTYFWLMPGILLIFIFKLLTNKIIIIKNRKKILLQLFISFSLLVALCSILFLSTSPNNSSDRPYLSQVVNADLYKVSDFLSGNWLGSRVIKSFINPLEATQRIYEISPLDWISSLYIILLYFFIPFSVFIILVKFLFLWKDINPAIIFYIAFLVTSFLIIRTKASFLMHHAILAFPFLILGVFSLVVPILKHGSKNLSLLFKTTKIWIIIFALLNLFFFFKFPNQNLWSHGENDISREEIRSVLNNNKVAEKYFYIITDWGMYYYQALYGPEIQSVLYMEPLYNKNQVDSLKALSEKYSRKVLFVYNSRGPSSNLQLIHDSFSVQRCRLIKESSTWQILME